MGSRRGVGGAWPGGAVLPALVFSYWVPVSWVAWEARELAYASGGCETGGDGTEGSAVEIKDNMAAFACAKVLLDRSRRMLSRREAAERLREILAE